MFYNTLETICKNHNTDVMSVTKELQIPNTTVYAWKRNGYTPRPNVVNKIAAKLDVEPTVFVEQKTAQTTTDPKKDLLSAFKNLSPRGQKIAVARVKELGEIQKYAV